MKKLLYAALALSFFVLPGCGDDDEKQDDPQPIAPAISTNTKLLTDRNWTLVGYESSAAPNPTPQTITESCKLDNTKKFDVNKTWAFDEGATKCSTTSPQTDSGTWDFLNGETQMYIDNKLWSIKELTDKKLKIRQDYTLNNKDYFTINTYEHK